MEIRDLTTSDEWALISFKCRMFKQRWTAATERMIRESVPDSIRLGQASGIGGWIDGGLVALSVWVVNDATWRSVVLATADGHRRREYAKKLKLELMQRARAAGAVRVLSFVHRDNESMCALNESLGARGVLDPADPLREYMIYEIQL